MSNFFEIAQIIIPAPQVGGRGLTLAEIGILVRIVADFLTSVGVIIGMIFIIVSGIIYMNAADETKIKKAKDWFKNAVLGSLIVLGVNVVINTIANVVTREFFCRLSFLGQCIF